MGNLRLVPIALRPANEWVTLHHRHSKKTPGHKFSVAVADEDGTVHGVAIAGRPKARMLDDGTRLECLRVCTDGTPNACSMLYGAVRRAGIAMGYEPARIITYTLENEDGASLRAAGWIEDGLTDDQEWHRDSRPRGAVAPGGRKRRWRAG